MYTLRLNLGLLYFINVLVVWRISPELIYIEQSLTPLTMLWIWGALSVLFNITVPVSRLFRIKGEKTKKEDAPKPTLGSLLSNLVFSLGLIPAIALLIYADVRLILGLFR